MKKIKKLRVALISIVIVLALLVFGYPSYIQNKFLYIYFSGFLNAIQQRDRTTVETFYKNSKNILPEYWTQMYKYKMMGWKINSISGQPWPLDDDIDDKLVEVSLYYEFTGKKLPENGRMIDHPKYGKVLEVATIFRFVPVIHGNKGTEISIELPGQTKSYNWLAPYEGN